MAKAKAGTDTPPAGTYKLIGVKWRRKNSDGSSTIYTRGEHVELDAEEAARLVGRKFSSFVAIDGESSVLGIRAIEDTTGDADTVKDKQDLKTAGK